MWQGVKESSEVEGKLRSCGNRTLLQLDNHSLKAPGNEAIVTFNLLTGKEGSCLESGNLGASVGGGASAITYVKGEHTEGRLTVAPWLLRKLADILSLV